MTDDDRLERRLREHYATIPAALPPEVADEVARRVGERPGRRSGRTWTILAAAAISTLVVSLAVGGGLRPAPTPQPSTGPSVSSVASPTLSSSPGLGRQFPAGTVVRATRAVQLASDWTIQPGQLAYIVEWPLIDADGRSYLIQTWGDLDHGLKPDTVFGAVPEAEAEAGFVADPPTCPTGDPALSEIAALHPFERLVCFGSRELTFGPVTASDYSVGAKTSKRWLSEEGRPDFFTGLPYYTADPSIAIADGEFVMVTGHFDEPSSAGCGDVAEVTWCRERFFITATTVVEPPAFVLRGTWRTLAPPPISGRSNHRLVWTGSEVLVWGGYASDEATSVFEAGIPRSGAAYDPVADTWRLIPDAPIAGRASPIAVFSGDELIVFGGATYDESGERPALDGAAWDPETDRWRTLPPAPLTGGATVGGWLGDRLVVVTNDAAAAYDPLADRWTVLPPAPIRPDWRTGVVAAGRFVVIAFGDGATPPVQEATLDPTTWTWTSADLDIDPLMAGADFISIGDLVLNPSNGMTFDPLARTWGSVTPCERVWGGIWTGSFVIGVQGAWDARTDTCLDVPPSPPREPPFDDTNGREFATAAWTGDEFITWSGGTGGDIVWMPKDGAAFRPEP